MRNAAHELSDGRQLLLLEQFLGEALVVRDIAHDAERTDDDAVLDHGRCDERSMPHAPIGRVIAQRTATSLAGTGILEQLSRCAEVAGIHHAGERRAEQLVAAAPHATLEGTVHGREPTIRVHGEDRIRGGLHQPGVARLGSLERDRPLMLDCHVARDSQYAHDVQSHPDGRVGHRDQPALAVSSAQAALEPHRLPGNGVPELLLHQHELVVVEQHARAAAEELGLRPAGELRRGFVHRREASVEIHGVDRVRRRLEQVAIARLRLDDGVARAPLRGDVAQRGNDAHRLALLLERRGRHFHHATLTVGAHHRALVPLRLAAERDILVQAHQLAVLLEHEARDGHSHQRRSMTEQRDGRRIREGDASFQIGDEDGVRGRLHDAPIALGEGGAGGVPVGRHRREGQVQEIGDGMSAAGDEQSRGQWFHCHLGRRRPEQLAVGLHGEHWIGGDSEVRALPI